MKYIISLEHPDFVLLMEVLKKAKDNELIAWNACRMVCEKTKVEFDK